MYMLYMTHPIYKLYHEFDFRFDNTITRVNCYKGISTGIVYTECSDIKFPSLNSSICTVKYKFKYNLMITYSMCHIHVVVLLLPFQDELY